MQRVSRGSQSRFKRFHFFCRVQRFFQMLVRIEDMVLGQFGMVQSGLEGARFMVP